MTSRGRSHMLIHQAPVVFASQVERFATGA